MGKGLFTNDLFNGEALGQGPRHDTGSGIFRANLFDAQPLGQTTPSTTTPSEDTLMASISADFPAPGPTTGGAKTTGGPAYSPYAPTGGKTGGTVLTSYGPTAPGMPMTYGATESEIPWVPIALIGGAVVLTVGFVAMSGRRAPAATANKRRARRNARRKHRRSR